MTTAATNSKCTRTESVVTFRVKKIRFASVFLLAVAGTGGREKMNLYQKISNSISHNNVITYPGNNTAAIEVIAIVWGNIQIKQETEQLDITKTTINHTEIKLMGNCFSWWWPRGEEDPSKFFYSRMQDDSTMHSSMSNGDVLIDTYGNAQSVTVPSTYYSALDTGLSIPLPPPVSDSELEGQSYKGRKASSNPYDLWS